MFHFWQKSIKAMKKSRIFICFLVILAVFAVFSLQDASSLQIQVKFDIHHMKLDNLQSLDQVTLSKIIGNLSKILMKWQKSKLQINETYEYDFKEFYNDRIRYINTKVDVLNVFKIDDKKLREIISNYKSDALNYANNAKKEPNISENDVIYTYKRSLDQILKMKDLNGNRVVNRKNRYYSYSYLNQMLYLEAGAPSKIRTIYNVYITNNIILDDAYDIPVHTLIRGGVINGFCNTESGSILISYFPQVYKADLFNNRSDEFASKRDEIIALVIAHEMGHCFGGLKDEYIDKSSIMYPVNGFKYMEWYQNLKY